jgi:AbiV family abortive infection protein
MAHLNFLSLKKEECIIEANKIHMNADEKWNSALILAKNKDFGSASSLLIISVEEYIKSLIVLLDGKGFGFRLVPGIGNIFRSHDQRLILAFLMFVMSILTEEFIENLQNFKIKHKEESLRRNTNHNPNVIPDFISKILQNITPKITDSFNWFKNIEDFRQQGFYSDFDNNDSKSENHYHLTLSKLATVKYMCKSLTTLIESDRNEDKEKIEQLKLELVKGNFTENLGVGLNKLKMSKKNAFQLVNELFNM